MYLKDLWVEPTAVLDGLAVHMWVADDAGRGVAGAEVALTLATAGNQTVHALAAHTDADGSAVAVAWGDPFEVWQGWTQAEITGITHPDYRLDGTSLIVEFPGNFWFPTGCCETQPGAANYGLRNTTWCPLAGLARIATRQGNDGTVQWVDAGSLEATQPQMGFLDHANHRWLILPLGIQVDAGAMQPCP